MLPPTSVPDAPLVIRTSPLNRPATPVPIFTPPLEPLLAIPVVTEIEPLGPVPAVPVPITTEPLMDCELAPD